MVRTIWWPSNEAYNKYRTYLIEFMAYAIAKGELSYNEAEATLKRSLSVKLEINQKNRQPLTLDQFWALHGLAGKKGLVWMQTAMEWTLLTLQGRNETVNFKFDDDRDGYLYIIREKTSQDSDEAFIRIEKDSDHERLIQAMKNTGILSPYLIHYNPKSRQRAHLDAKPHWSSVMPDYFTNQFRLLVIESGLFDHLKEGQRPPTPHEMRGLGSRLYIKAGYNEEHVQYLMCHTDSKTSKIYTQGGKEALKDSDYLKVRGGLKIADLK